eukprot:COSAG04_NODE_15_length_40535_cov_25.319888_25_plen_238_part_00
MTSRWAAAHADALLVAGCGGEQGGAALFDVLTGAVGPAGRLPYEIHRDQADLEDITVYGDLANQTYRNRQFAPAPLYRFGDGRSYSRFLYSSVRLSPAAPGVCDSVTLHVDVKNAGAEAAEEVVQVYSRCPCSAALCQAGSCTSAALSAPPSTALIAFTRTSIAAGATATVSLPIATRQRARFRAADMEEVVRPGELWLTVGGGQLGSSTAGEVLQLRANVTGQETALAACAPVRAL